MLASWANDKFTELPNDILNSIRLNCKLSGYGGQVRWFQSKNFAVANEIMSRTSQLFQELRKIAGAL